MTRPKVDPEFLERRLDQIIEGLREGIRREVERLRREGLPIYVQENGKIVDLNAPDASTDTEPASS